MRKLLLALQQGVHLRRSRAMPPLVLSKLLPILLLRLASLCVCESSER